MIESDSNGPALHDHRISFNDQDLAIDQKVDGRTCWDKFFHKRLHMKILTWRDFDYFSILLNYRFTDDSMLTSVLQIFRMLTVFEQKASNTYIKK